MARFGGCFGFFLVCVAAGCEATEHDLPGTSIYRGESETW